MLGKVLVIDREERTRKLLKLHLENNNYTVIKASDRKAVLQLIQTERPDILVLDVLAPELSGIEVCKMLRKDPLYCDLPIIFMSKLNTKESIIKCLDAGGDDYVIKPFDPDELIARINAILRRMNRSYLKTEEIETYEPLTQQEINVLRLLKQGYTNKEIANQLFLTEGTVKIYNHYIYQKLQVNNRIQATTKAKKMELI